MYSRENRPFLESAKSSGIGRTAAFLLWVPLALALLVALLPKNADCQSREDRVAEYFRSVQEALRQGEFTRATEEFKKVLAVDPTLVEAEVNLGLAYHSLSEYE